MSSSTLAAGLHQLRGRLALHYRPEQSDEQLLQAFHSQHDDSAFAALVRRHGPMVLQVCRRILGHQQDAEDAFQATFLVLARNAAGLRNPTFLASYLHGTAYRTAMKAKQSAARRRKHEGQAQSRASVDPAEQLSWREAQTLLDQEITRLPAIYQSVFVLCCMENLSRLEAAQRLGLKERTVLSRLAVARKRLHQRLSRRGVELTALLAATALTTEKVSALPAALVTKTIRGTVSPVVAALAAHSLPLMGKVKLAALVVAASLLLSAGLWACYAPATSPHPNPPPQGGREKEKAPSPLVGEGWGGGKETEKSVAIGGRVLDPDGKPVQKARVYLPLLKGEQLRSLATSDAAGQFHFAVKPAEVGLYRHLSEPWRYVQVMAVAEGYGPGIATVGNPDQAEKLTLQLATDDVPIKGRVLDLQGKPLAGVTIRVDGVGVPNKGDLTAFLKDLQDRTDGYPAENALLTTVHHGDFTRLWPAITTDADGRFQVTGIGRERVAYLTIAGPTIETAKVRVRTRPGDMIHKMEWATNPQGGRMIYYGATFEHVAAPSKPIVGMVRDRKTGKPLANVSVRSYKLANSNVHGTMFLHTVTDKDGRYRLTGMPRGEGGSLIVAEPAKGLSYLGLLQPVDVSKPDREPVTVDFDLRRGVLVKGRVFNKQTGAGEPQAQLDYFVFEDNPWRQEYRDSRFHNYLHTETDGSFEMVVPPGHALLAARATTDRFVVGVGAEKIDKRDIGGGLSFLPTAPLCDPMAYHRLFEINPSKDEQTLTCNLDLDPGRTLKGTVVDQDGKPLAGAKISGLRSYAYTYWENEPLPAAEFTIYALTPDRPRLLEVIHEGKHLAGSLVVKGDDKGPVTVKLQPAGTLTGRLVTPSGGPYPKGEMRFGIAQRRDDVTVGTHPLHAIPRDKQGRFHVEGLIPGLKYSLIVIPAGNVGKEIIVKPGETKDLGDVSINN